MPLTAIMSSTGQENFQWLSVTEETLFLHDGLIRVTDLVELPTDVNNTAEGEHEVITFDLKNPVELSERLLAVCGTQNNAYSKLLEYRLNALRGLWNAQRQISVEEENERETTTTEETISLLKKQGLWKEPEQATFSTRISVLLVLPLLQSQSKLDSSLCGVTAEVLLNCLRDCAPISLSKEPGDCLNGLESLLCRWLGEQTGSEQSQAVQNILQRRTIASTLVALACARGHLKTFIHTVHLLQKLGDLESLPVADILTKLLDTEGGQGHVPAVLGSKHVLCWGFEDLLSGTEKESGEKDKADGDVGRSLACDGLYLYTTNACGKGLARIGTGLHGLLRGYVYGRNSDIGPGKIAYGNKHLLYRPQAFDQETDVQNLCQIVDRNSLQAVKTIPKPESYVQSGVCTTIAFCSDGTYFYWVWCPAVVADKNVKGAPVYVEMFSFQSEDCLAVPVQPRVTLQKKDEAGGKILNETLLSRLRPSYRVGSASTLAALTGTEPPGPSRKEDGAMSAGSTTCGVLLKVLVKTPVFCDGSHVVLLTPLPGGNTSSATRSLFGSSGSLAALRSLATNVCFTLKDGQFAQRPDLMDAPGCSLARGAPLASIGACFDVHNNLIWLSSADWVDQFCNPGHQAPHHIKARLGIQQSREDLGKDNTVSISVVIKELLQHVGGMCLHQINSDILYTPLGSYMVQQYPVDLLHLRRICDILQNSIQEWNSQIIICALIVLQLIFKVSVFKKEKPGEEDLIKTTSDLVWKLLSMVPESRNCSPADLGAIQKEACIVITNGLTVMYPTSELRNRLMMQLLTDSSSPGQQCLRDMLLVDFADQLKAQAVKSEHVQHLRLTDDTVHLILKMTMKESCCLLTRAQTANKEQFEALLLSIPCASPCLRYLMSLQSHLLREAVLFSIPEEDKNKTNAAKQKLKELQTDIQSFATKVFTGSCQVLEVLLESCNQMINMYKDDLENRLQGLEKVAKATILGHMLPSLLTSMTHTNLRCLTMADALMPRLVQLVVLTSQAALLLKSQVQAILHEDMALDTDSDVIDLIGQSVSPEKLDLSDQEEQGFLAGLKIPAPWASGKSLESIHPVRDNYKFKETVHIPGARCLYLRFDQRCSSQYDYDKMVVHAGPNTNSKKVAEYGGNTFGFGSRSVLGSGWPKDLVKVEGDTVTFSFEMRSGREHNTPDKAMWGFHITVRAQESPEEVSNGLPFLADLGLGLSVLACTMLHLLYQGPEKTREEESCQHLLKSKLLQRCVWQSGSSGSLPPVLETTKLQDSQQPAPTSPKLPHIKLPAEILQNLRTLAPRHPPHIRASIREVIQPDVIEERIVSAIMKHLGLQDTVRYFTPSKQNQTEEFMLLGCVMEEVCRRTDALVRQLQGLADLEQRWSREVMDAKQESTSQEPPFFHDYHLQETKIKELLMLCFVKEVTVDQNNLEDAVKTLWEKFECAVKSNEAEAGNEAMCRTRQLVEGILARLDLLLHVNISPPDPSTLTRTVSQCIEAIKLGPSVMVRSDTDVLHQTPLLRSMSAPSGVDSFKDDTALEFGRLHRRRPGQKTGPTSILQGLIENTDEKGQPPHVVLIGQLFSFIGSQPEKAISSSAFLNTAQLRWWRGNTRKQALVHMKELLSAASRVGGATHLVAAVTSVLRHGPRVEELTCGGMVNQVREAFAETMTSVVQLAARYPMSCCNSIGLLCIVPYTRAEEKCLVRSGLVHLLDKLCSLANHRTDVNMDTQSTRQKVSAMAWAGFQVLANRCVMWETEDGSQWEDLEHSGLARQVSVLLTNHLARATETGGNEAAGTEALQEVLSLLNNLSRSRMGKAILSQPACVSKLLSLLLDQRPSPKLVLIILQLCRVALPLMSTVDCKEVELPSWGQQLTYWSTAQSISDAPARIVSLLLARLGDFLVPGDLATVASRQQSIDNDLNKGGVGGDKEKGEDTDIQNGRLSVFIHKREDQFSHEVIQPLLSSENRPFRLGGGNNMDKVVRMDREMTKSGKAEVATEDAMTALRKAAKWSQMGLVVSTGPPVDTTQIEVPTGDKKKTEKETVCREKNAELARTDPVRPFISGHVANSMATEVIELLHSLLNAPECNTAKSWAEAVQRVLVNALSSLPVLLSSIESMGSPRCHSNQLMMMARQVNAALCALGGFEEMVKPGCHVTVTGEVENTTGTVVSVSALTGLVSVKLDPQSEDGYAPRYSETVQVPVGRLQPSRNKMFTTQQLSMTEAVVMATQSILLPSDDTSPLQQQLPMTEDGNSLTNQMCRVVAELETRACMVLALYLQDISFAKEFIQHCGSTIDILKSLAKECSTGDRQQVVKSLCDRLRMLYRDCAKPPPPPSKVDNRNKEMVWDTSRTFPPVRACLFSHGLTGITFLGDPSAGRGLPRGTLVYANMPIPFQAPSFYWELEVCSFGDTQEESAAIVSFGFAPLAEKKDGAWTNPVGTCLFLNNGKAVHYNGASLLQWYNVRLDVSVGAGDVAGVGWERTGDAPVQGQTPKGRVYFTYNGRKLQATIDDVSGAMYPVVHIQKKNTRVKANFGARPYAFAEGQQHREAADEADDLTREIRESFSQLPFHCTSDSDSEGAATATSTPSNSMAEIKDIKTPPGPPCKTVPVPKPLKEYNAENCKHYKLFYSYDNMITTGPDPRTSLPVQESVSDDESVDDEQPNEDHYALLVKSWEQKVFPIIRRRFRNEAERKDGLEQIRGALQLGMTDIARQTVEFLYEENGGMPRDLHLPTIDDIKEDLAKFTIDRVRKGTTVIIKDPTGSSSAGTTVLPKFAVRSMLKTFGLTGTVLDIDTQNELVQVETYLRSEGVLVRFWYPLIMLERPPQGMRKSTITGGQILDTSNVNIHRELVRSERTLARMYCRTALLKLIDHCNSSSAMEVISCSTSLASGMAASAALLQELDIENIQLLSNELLRSPQPHGTIKATSLVMSDSVDHCLAPQSCSLSSLLYMNVDRLKKELAVAIARAANQGEDYLTELTNQICICLQTAPEMFQYEEYPVTEVKTSTDIHFPGAACLIVSCKTDPKATKKETSLYKSPWARVFCYTGQRIKKTGQVSKQEVVSYPRDTSSTSNQNEQYIPAIIPCDRIHLRLGVSPPPGIIVTIHALPPQFLLAITYIETLISEKHGCGMNSCRPPRKEEPDKSEVQVTSKPSFVLERVDKDRPDSLWNLDNIVITPPVFSHMIEQLCGYMWRTDIPALVKEYLYHNLAQSVRILHYCEGGNGTKLPTLHPHLNPACGLLVQLRAELKILYDTETKGWATMTTPSGAGIGIGVTDQGRFSTYFHALMEANLAVAEINKSTGRAKGAESALSTEFTPKRPTSPTHLSKRKKLKTKREKKESSHHRRSEGLPRTSESDLDSGLPLTPPPSTSSPSLLVAAAGSGSDQSLSASVPTSSTVSPSSSHSSQDTKEAGAVSQVKPEDIMWFHRALTVSQILRCLAFREKNGTLALVDAISDANQVLSVSTAHQRLLIVTGIPSNLDPEFVKQAMQSVLKANGGIDREDIYLPYLEEEITPKKTAEPSAGEAAKDGESTESESNAAAAEPAKRRRKMVDKEIKLYGFAVLSLMSKTKLESVKKGLLKCRSLVEGLNMDQNDPIEMPTISTVSPWMIAENNANEALESFLQYKFFSDKDQNEISDGATLALTEIFHACFIVEQRHGSTDFRQESGFICLGKDQILQHMPENLLCTFFSHVRPPKKSLLDQVMQVLRRYGMTQTPDKESSPGSERGKGKGKKPQRSSKEKVVLAVEKTSSKEKKPKEKEYAEKSEKDEETSEGLGKAAKTAVQKEEYRCLTLDGFLQFTADLAKQDIRATWRALLACGFDMHFDRCACLDNSQAQQMARQWTVEMDMALTQFVNAFCRKLAVCPARLHPHEVFITQEELTNEKYTSLQGVPIESVRLRFAFLQSLNNTLETFFLPLLDLRPTETFSRSTAALLSQVRSLVFYDTKVSLMNRVLNATVQRKPDQAAPEINLDPLEVIGGEAESSLMTTYCQAFRQLSAIPSSQLCVRLASGGDPTYSFNIKFAGEEVHGTSGSFRHFLWQIARELQGPLLNILIPCTSPNNRGKCVLKPGPLTYAEEKLLHFLGQLLGITIRADIPFGLDILASFWKALVGVPLDPVTDLQEVDLLTYSYMKRIEMVESEPELLALCVDMYPKFMYPALTGEEVELVPGGSLIPVSWENRQQYVEAIRHLRICELLNQARIKALSAGLATIIPLQLLTIMSPFDMELRTCGIPNVDLEFLKAHTMYQVGLVETDRHIEYFWNTLEGLSQEDLCRFIKFACNQDRIPQTCPCRTGGADVSHVPPYPMKIAPPDGPGSPDARYIRVETCLFMVKLPQYSSQEIMTQRLLYAINCREDPLSG